MIRRVGCPSGAERGQQSQYAVAASLGISRARVAQIEERALSKLRARLERLGVTDGASSEAINWWGEGESE